MKRLTLFLLLSLIFNYCFAQLNVSISSYPDIVCRGYYSVLTANVSGGTQPYTYHWNVDSTTSSITVFPTGTSSTYSVTVTDNNSASNSATTTIYIDPIEIENIQPVYSGDTVDFDVSYIGEILQWQWNCGTIGWPPFIIDSIPITCCLIVVSTNGCMDTSCATAYPTSINTYSGTSLFSIFPNPSSDKNTIIIPLKTTIEILNINGQIINKIISVSPKTLIDITGLSSGVYIVRLKTDKELITKKIIKE